MIPYLQRTRDYYAAQGYAPYRWATYDDVPFQTPTKPLAESRVVLLTTAAPIQPEAGNQGPGAPYNAQAKFFEVFRRTAHPPPDLRISHIAYDRAHCQADDPRTWLPVPALRALQSKGMFKALTEDLIGIPTNRSQRVTIEQDAPAALEHAQNLSADVALLVPT